MALPYGYIFVTVIVFLYAGLIAGAVYFLFSALAYRHELLIERMKRLDERQKQFNDKYGDKS